MTLAYDTSGRLSGVNSDAGSFSYGYVTDSELLSGLTGPQVTTTYTYEHNRDLRTEVLNQIGTTVISRYGYRSDGIARRKDRVKEGTAFSAGVYDRFAYNDRNEVTLTRNYTGTNPDGASDPETVALARHFSYDAIGNRLTSQSGTSSIRGYTSNALNQYTALTNPSASPVHDLDGNQTQSGTGWYYEWDAENRLTLARDYATSPINGSKKLEFTYDYRSRRIRKIESSYVSSAWTVLEDRKFIYGGWNLLGEFATSGFARICAYTWGLDLSQTHQGAGGVGGLLAVTTAMPSTATFFATYDGNGNISEYISSSGGIEAHFEYDAFGELSASTGSNLGRFSHRFSSKYWDSSTGFYYYGFRYYYPSTGRWPSRDPIGEQGGLNLYGFVVNSPLDLWDNLGLDIEASERVFRLGGGLGPSASIEVRVKVSAKDCCLNGKIIKNGERSLSVSLLGVGGVGVGLDFEFRRIRFGLMLQLKLAQVSVSGKSSSPSCGIEPKHFSLEHYGALSPVTHTYTGGIGIVGGSFTVHAEMGYRLSAIVGPSGMVYKGELVGKVGASGNYFFRMQPAIPWEDMRPFNKPLFEGNIRF